MGVVIDGNDGVGKSTVCAALRALGYEVSDRGLPTRLTDHPEAISGLNPGDTYIVMDAPVEVSRDRLRVAGKDLNEHWHQVPVLIHYRERFLDVARQLGAPVVDASGTFERTIREVRRHLPVPTRAPLIERLTDKEFESMPLVVEGESKVVRDAGDGLAVIRYKPTIYSFTHGRTGVVLGSDVLRLRAVRALIHGAGLEHAYLDVSDRYVLSRLIRRPPPIEVVVKAFHMGTSKHRYVGMAGRPVRDGHPCAGFSFEEDGRYPNVVVRFDWRNPMHHPTNGKLLADEVLGEDHADWFIDVAKARETALNCYQALTRFLGPRGIILCDICFFITEDGATVFGEVSQDCGRFRHHDMGSLDKDVWRAGGSSEQVLEKWRLILGLIEF